MLFFFNLQIIPASPQDGPHPEVMPNGGSGMGFHGLETGREFQWVGLREQQRPTHQTGTEFP